MKAKGSAILSHPLARVAMALILMGVGAFVPFGGVWCEPLLSGVALLLVGVPIFLRAVRTILRGDLLDETFLMSLASIGAFCLGDFAEAVAVLAFFTVGETFEHYAVRRSREGIKSLMTLCPDTATVLRDGEECEIDAEDVAIGQTVLLRTGERVCVDGTVLEGRAELDTSALTGESLPRSVSVGDSVESGTLVLEGFLKVRTDRIAEESAVARILSMVEDASEHKAREEAFITRFSRVYTPVVVALALLLAIVPAAFGLLAFGESVRRALTFLVISCPCALVISVPMAFFGGIGSAARRGVLFKGGNVFAPLCRSTAFAFDKTGTLTTGTLAVAELHPVGIAEGELLSLAASAEYASSHPIARAVKAAAGEYRTPDTTRELTGLGMEIVLDGATVLVGSTRLLASRGILPEEIGGTALHIARDGVYLGYILLSDTVKAEAKTTLEDLRALGVHHLCMLSGDRTENARSVGTPLGLDAVYGDLMPEDKYQKLNELLRWHDGVVYVGDGINDTPSLALASVGIAMGERGSDSAIESADVVIMSDDLARLPEARRIAAKTLRIAKENIVFALGVKLLVLILGALGYANMWLSVFADVGVSILAILNAMRTMRYDPKDHAKQSLRGEQR